ncbi:MAG: hypothetical protein SFY92_03510 [Verrucomicrobiae bacterium]|nr:hypothetical protein [Verrucomicrobiae bacterium]
MNKIALSLIPCLALLFGCAPTVKLAAPEKPIKVDINMNVNVRNAGSAPETPDAVEPGPTSVQNKHRITVSEISGLLSRGVVGLNRQGLYETRPLGPRDTDLEYIEKTVKAANASVNEQLDALHAINNRPLDLIRADYLERAVKSLPSGSWYESRNSSGQWVWQQKK